MKYGIVYNEGVVEAKRENFKEMRCIAVLAGGII